MNKTEDMIRQRERAALIQSEYSAELSKLRADKDLSDQGRQRRMAQAYRTAKERLTEMSRHEREVLAERRAELETKFFGIGDVRMDSASKAISARDAADRAAQIKTANEAVKLFRRATEDGDEVLARAVARHAMESSEAAMTRDAAAAWEGVVRNYLDNRPHLEPVINELADIETMTGPQIMGSYSITRPHGVDNVYLNEAISADTEAAV